MSTQFNQVQEVLEQLHKSGHINLDKSMHDLLGAREALTRLSPGGEVATAVIAWDGYAVVIKNQEVDAANLAAVANELRTLTNTLKK
jgi:hypothetical protein